MPGGQVPGGQVLGQTSYPRTSSPNFPTASKKVRHLSSWYLSYWHLSTWHSNGVDGAEKVWHSSSWYLSSWHLSSWHLYSKKFILQPRDRRAHRNPPSNIPPQSVGMIYPIPTYIFSTDIFSQTLGPKLSNSNSSPKCWHDIFNANIYIQKCIFPNPVPEGRTETLQLTFIHQVLA